ncbi:hypothetical protein FQN54_004819 [Arachnomyces sp. PD_36]|nr:hypothetical protein FQN54_004819 [Arachnomyces sp. PD_36]
MASKGESSATAERRGRPSRSTAESSAGPSNSAPKRQPGLSHFAAGSSAGPSNSRAEGSSRPFHSAAESSAGPSHSAPRGQPGSSRFAAESSAGPSNSRAEGSSGPSLSAKATGKQPAHSAAQSTAGPSHPRAESSSGNPPAPLSAKAKGKQPTEPCVPANYRVYCISRSIFIDEPMQVQRFIFPGGMPPRFFELGLHNERDMRGGGELKACRMFREDNNQIIDRLVQTHTKEIFATRTSWSCVICGGVAVRLFHGVIPHFEVRQKRREGGEDEEEEEVPYGASLTMPLTERKVYEVKGSEGERHTERLRRYANRLATERVGEGGIPRENLRPCVVDIAVPVCLNRVCHEIAYEVQKGLAHGLLRGEIRGDPEDMLCDEPDEDMLCASESKGVEEIVPCANCGSVDEKDIIKCDGCQAVGYCSRACQRWHWQRHSRDCEVINDREHAAILLELSKVGIEKPRGRRGPSLGSAAGLVGLEPIAEEDSEPPHYSDVEDGDGDYDKVPSKPNKGKARDKGKGKARDKGKGKAKETWESMGEETSGEAEHVGVEPEEEGEQLVAEEDQGVIQVLEKTDIEAEVLGAEGVGGAATTVRVEVTVKEVEESLSDTEPQGTHEVTDVVGGASQEVVGDEGEIDTAAVEDVEPSTAGDQNLPEHTEPRGTHEVMPTIVVSGPSQEVMDDEDVTDTAATEGVEPSMAGNQSLPEDSPETQGTQKASSDADDGPSEPKIKNKGKNKAEEEIGGAIPEGEEVIGDEGTKDTTATEGAAPGTVGDQKVPEDTEQQDTQKEGTEEGTEGVSGPSTPWKNSKRKHKGKKKRKSVGGSVGDEGVKDTAAVEGGEASAKEGEQRLAQDTENVGEDIKEEEDTEKQEVEKETEGGTEGAEGVTEAEAGDGDGDGGDGDGDDGAVEVSNETEATEQPEAGEVSLKERKKMEKKMRKKAAKKQKKRARERV